MDGRSEITQHYDRMQISTSGLPHLICLMHHKIVLYIKKYGNTHNRRDIDTAQNLLATLSMSLKEQDHLSVLLQNTYSYCYLLLEECGVEGLSNATEIIEILEDTFSELCGNSKEV